MSSPLPTPQRRRRRLGRFAAAVGVAGVAFVVWVAWLGWPSPARVLTRVTALAGAEAGPWMDVGPELSTRSVRVMGESGLAVNLRVLRPAGAGDARLPVLVLLGGHRTGRDAVDVVGHPGRLIVVALDYPYDGPDRLRGVRQILGSLPPIRRALLNTPAAVSLALDWVVEQPWADPERVELVGVSLGTQFAAAAGAGDDRFRRVWFVQGAADSRSWLAHQLDGRVGTPVLREAAASGLWWVAHGASLDPQLWIRQISPRPVVVIGARQDPSLPRGLVTEVYEAAGWPRRIDWVDGGHISPRRPETIRPLLELIIPEVEL